MGVIPSKEEQRMINELIENLVCELKKEEVYQNYMNALNNLNQHASLLSEYKATKEQYIKMKPYFKYQDFSELKERFAYLADQVTNLKEFQDYQMASNQLKNRLDGLTSMIFDNVLLEVEESACVSSQENTNEEI